MPDINEIYGEGGNFIKTADIPRGQIAEFKIKSVEAKKFNDKNKLVATCEGDKLFVLNKTNAKSLALAFGTSDYTQWAGRSFKAIRTSTQFNGGTVECLRVL